MTTAAGDIVQLDAGAAARGAILRLARDAQAKGMFYQAIHAYNHLLEQYPATKESRKAVGELIGLAQFLEQQGRYHTAMSLYQRLEDLT